MDITIYDIAILPFIMAFVEMLKKSGLPVKLLPFAAIFLGAVAGVVFISPGDIPQGVLVGTAIGLAASGAYSGGKTVIEKSGE